MVTRPNPCFCSGGVPLLSPLSFPRFEDLDFWALELIFIYKILYKSRNKPRGGHVQFTWAITTARSRFEHFLARGPAFASPSSWPGVSPTCGRPARIATVAGIAPLERMMSSTFLAHRSGYKLSKGIMQESWYILFQLTTNVCFSNYCS